MNDSKKPADSRHHLDSLLMRESLLDKQVMARSESNVVRMLPNAHVVKIGAGSFLDKGREATGPVIEAIGNILESKKLIVTTGGGARTRHLFSIGLDLGLPTGVLAQLSAADALGNAHLLGALLAPYGVVAIPPEILGHLLPLFVHAVPGVIFHGVPPYALWEHLPSVGRIPPHRSDAGAFLLCETFGCKTLTLVKDVDGVFTADPKTDPKAEFIRETTVADLRERNLATLPFDRVLIELLEDARLLEQFQVVNGNHPELLARAIDGEHVGTVVKKT